MSLRGGLFLRRMSAVVHGDAVCSVSVFLRSLGCRGMASPFHDTGPHAGLCDLKKKKISTVVCIACSLLAISVG